MLPRSIFYHIPKTAGEWVRAAIARAGIPAVELGPSPNPIVNKHNTYRTVEANGKFKFAFVRHPLQWYPSFWSYRMFNGWRTDDILDACMSVDFEIFVRNVLKRFPSGHCAWRYQGYIGPPPGLLDFVGKTQTLPQDLVRALRLAGEEFDEKKLLGVAKLNDSPLRPSFSPKLRRAVLDAERKVLERFGYDEDPEAVIAN